MAEPSDDLISKPSSNLLPLTGEGVVIDIGTGDGLFVYESARANPNKFYIGIDEGTARHRNLEHNPSITIMIAEGWKRQAILEGETRMLDLKGQTAARVLDAQKKKYGWTTQLLAEVLLQKIFTYKGTSKSN